MHSAITILGTVISPSTNPVAVPKTDVPASTNVEVGAATQKALTTQAATAPAAKGFFEQFGMLPIMVLIFVVMYFLLFHPQRKEEKKRKSMIETMKKGDEVMTIGGLVGKVVDVKEDRVVIKIDESNNVKATYLKTAIQRVLTNDAPEKK